MVRDRRGGHRARAGRRRDRFELLGGETKVQTRVERLYTLDDPRFTSELGVLLGPTFLDGTRVRALLNGEQIFPPMLAAIRAAKVSITFETYIYWSGDVGREFAEALAERARQGVKVRLAFTRVVAEVPCLALTRKPHAQVDPDGHRRLPVEKVLGTSRRSRPCRCCADVAGE